MSYKIGIVYKIIHTQSNLCYVGSTFNELRHRWRQHKLNFKLVNEGKAKNKYVIFDSFKKYGIENFKMIEIKKYEVVDRSHLNTKEQLWINKLKSINKYLAIKFLWEDYLAKIYSKKYSQLNKKKILEKAKIYREKNKEAIKIKYKEYCEKNKEILAKKRKEKVLCEICNVTIVKQGFKRHCRTLLHVNNLNNK